MENEMTKTQLKKLIREEIQKMTESDMHQIKGKEVKDIFIKNNYEMNVLFDDRKITLYMLNRNSYSDKNINKYVGMHVADYSQSSKQMIFNFTNGKNLSVHLDPNTSVYTDFTQYA